ncbi:hypothetical protein ACGLFO_10475 [Corynebacterium hesseae]|uniref:hypothetical protein n=1 Tax=Corynebacterium TaxID=1716 RepID=UPI001438A153|nr:hypothetical protein [Corynebacterium sp. HMSC06D04]
MTLLLSLAAVEEYHRNKLIGGEEFSTHAPLQPRNEHSRKHFHSNERHVAQASISSF